MPLKEGDQCSEHTKTTGWSRHHLTVFCLTFMGCAYFRTTRKCFSNVKNTISQEWTPSFGNGTISQPLPDEMQVQDRGHWLSYLIYGVFLLTQVVDKPWMWNSRHVFADKEQASVFLGGLDTAFLLSYAVGLFISGFVGDRIDLRLVLTFGMCTSSISVFMVGMPSELLHLYNVYYYMVFWILNGLLQSGWPAMIAIMANWFGKSSRGFVLGLWCSCTSVGNIIAALLGSAVLDYGYQYVFLVPASMLFGMGIIIFFGLIPHPHDVGLTVPGEDGADGIVKDITQEEEGPLLDSHVPEEQLDSEGGTLTEGNTDDITVRPTRVAMGFLQALLLPGVIPCSLAFACLEFVNYAFFFWLPFYLTSKYGWEESVSDQMSVWYDVGSIIGGAIGGFLSDRLGLRITVVMVMMACALPSLYLYSVAPAEKILNSFLMGLTGLWIGGACKLIGSIISADLGKTASASGNKDASATVPGIVSGMGSIGAAVGQICIPLIRNKYGWMLVFYLFMVMIGLTGVCLMPMQVKEILSMRCIRQCRLVKQPGTSPTTSIISSTYGSVNATNS